MKGRLICLDRLRGREAAALLVDGRLEDLLIDPPDDRQAPEAIFRAVVDRPVKGQGGLFVRLPEGSGFLRQTSGLAPGQRLLVQVSGVAEPGKAVPVTTRLLFKSRLCILTPGAPGLNISRRIRDEDLRAELSALAAEAMAGADEDLGLILRSACEGAPDSEIAAEIAETRALSEAVLADLSGDPELLVDAPGAHHLAWRDWSDPPPDEIDEAEGAFARHGVADLCDALLSPLVPLGGGAHMAVEPTRALVAVDVNTGADTSPAAALKANVAAARELPRQLRLRGLGGQVAIDFAPMPKKDRVALEQVLRAAFRGEAAETSLAGWTPLGLYELVRKRDRLPLAELLA
ncbi:ribonuclease E/G [Cereibacter azotoformans]|uniref:Rne/Rng family ribonuclease n=1 Tax=Cereibacter azotoformans TaxID=43057 RepID=A0A2T5K6X9_9RHOB|nr:ribonuclease E/G [Cereibacter azotoformans]AXQ92825.1 ribonuclease G [Cereibacter sphaeroides]MBO4169509.1 ribonuclease E/G [Cereibacter azotoformans]PTR18187.1 Rne/Rng family ribonuclease [Cereibacter azotoformans]UIJ31108.1 ribonuclease E/G [Cereibacter azotoformans]